MRSHSLTLLSVSCYGKSFVLALLCRCCSLAASFTIAPHSGRIIKIRVFLFKLISFGKIFRINGNKNKYAHKTQNSKWRLFFFLYRFVGPSFGQVLNLKHFSLCLHFTHAHRFTVIIGRLL